MKILFISPDYLKSYTTVNDAVDENIINSCITTAQDKVVKVYLGGALYKAMIDKVDGDTLSGDYATLMEDYIKPMLLWAAIEELYPYLVAKIDNGNIVQRVSEDTQPIDRGMYDVLINKAIANRQHYVQDFIDYMGAYSYLYPEYNNNTYPNRPPKRDNYKPNSMTFSRGNNAMSNEGQREYKWWLPSYAR